MKLFPYNKNIFKHLLLIFIIIVPLYSQNPDKEYLESIEKWHARRIASLEKKNSWLTLAGLFWLEPGKNSFGSSENNDFVFPKVAAKEMGHFFLQDTTVSIHINPAIDVMADSTVVSNMTLRNDNQPNTTILTYKSLTWYVIKRDDMYGVRLKDSDHPNLKNFQGIDRFPVDENWRIKAKLLPADSEKTIAIPNVLGQVSDAPSPGTLVFTVNGRECKLDPIGDTDDDQYWLIFGDATNGEETYGAGRFLYVESVDSTGHTNIDFNKAYNPPCVFSPFATCPLPPAQNKLDVKILAGEKNYENATH